MRKVLLLVAVFLASTLIHSCGNSAGPDREAQAFDEYGLNEVAGLFNGSYFNNYCGRDPYNYDAWTPGDDAAYLAANPGADNHWAWPYRSTRVLMKWNKAWPNDGGWITNHMWDSYVDGGVEYKWDYFVKIVWVGPPPSGTDPYAGSRIWNNFAIIQEVYNDTGTGDHGNIPKPGPRGFGAY